MIAVGIQFLKSELVNGKALLLCLEMAVSKDKWGRRIFYGHDTGNGLVADSNYFLSIPSQKIRDFDLINCPQP